MRLGLLDFSEQGRLRVWLLTAAGTLACIAAAWLLDGVSLHTATWRPSTDPLNALMTPVLLAPVLLYLLLEKLRQLNIAHHELVNIASTDALTATLNRRAFTAMVEAWLDRVAKQNAGARGGFLIIDVDHFKQVNDTYGHERGDQALKLIAASIRGAIRETDLVGRMGGEEFGVFLPGLTPEHALGVAERIREAVHEVEFYPTAERHHLSVSIGGAVFDCDASFLDLYKQADKHLYTAKREGRDRVEMHALVRAQPAI